jgi:hypothetical protein
LKPFAKLQIKIGKTTTKRKKNKQATLPQATDKVQL